MLVWLASYPRSGNTLLRQVLKRCFGIDSYESLDWDSVRISITETQEQQYHEYWGHVECTTDPAQFLERAASSEELITVKTHTLPTDDHKAIYVIRDGRLALRSLLKFEKHYSPGQSDFLSLLVGDHVYGGWSEHVEAWLARPGRTLVLRFEELVNVSAETLEEIATFLDYQGPITPWQNPQEELRRIRPEFFGKGDSQWRANEFRTETRLRFFFTLHGPMMQRLGYASAEEVERFRLHEDRPEEADLCALLRYAQDVQASRRELQQACDQRAKTIEGLEAACRERLALIEQLNATCQERLEVIRQAEASPSSPPGLAGRVKGAWSKITGRLRGSSKQAG